jgi:hypothetical protein
MFDVLKHRSSSALRGSTVGPIRPSARPCRLLNRHNSGGKDLPGKKGEIAKRTQFHSKHLVLQILTTKIFLFSPKANLMIPKNHTRLTPDHTRNLCLLPSIKRWQMAGGPMVLNPFIQQSIKPGLRAWRAKVHHVPRGFSSLVKATQAKINNHFFILPLWQRARKGEDCPAGKCSLL